MQSLWSDSEARACGEDLLALRVYSSRLLGQESALVLHGGGNTSVKVRTRDFFGDEVDVLYVKGSGWDLATIEAGGFAPVRMETLLKMAKLETLSDSDMVTQQRAAMLDPYAPTPSVEAILHAIIPYRFVDHTHADAVVTIMNSPDGDARVRALYGERWLIVPYVMPGFVLARTVYEMTAGLDWSRYDGMILLHHGVFTFADDARASYEAMIAMVAQAEDYLAQVAALPALPDAYQMTADDRLKLATLRRRVSRARGSAQLALADLSPQARLFAQQSPEIATRGPLTPDHVIRTKRIALTGVQDTDVDAYEESYRAYFAQHASAGLRMLDAAPRWGVWQDRGTLAFGSTVGEVRITADIVQHTTGAILRAEALGGWRALSAREIFEVEYWELEQAKLKKVSAPAALQGKIALVTGAASGIGRACAEALHARGAAVVALDISPAVTEIFGKVGYLPLVVDLMDDGAVRAAVDQAVERFGGLDLLVSNAGFFPPSRSIRDMDAAQWERSMALNVTSHQRLLQACIPYLEVGIDAAVVLVASKNVPAPGPGASAYSSAKAALTQLGRVAALELGKAGIRVNMVHPNQVFDTALWTPDILAARAKHYGVSVEEYKRQNVLGVEITSADVAELVCAMLGKPFARTTGAQVPIDGGNERVI
jgi:rhamnose utilization protein RhaD (predicted bifunctional aldolase and dehydrogenase)/NAD(P)-dependent dehydrogenase (short-subunit alcohol dehydrogenase family)